MLKQRVITALILVTLFLAAVFALPALGWSALVVGVVLLGAFEWGRLAKLSRSGEVVYLGLTFAIMAGIIGYALAGGEKLALLTWSIYALAAVFWLALALPWLLLGWHVRQPVAACPDRLAGADPDRLGHDRPARQKPVAAARRHGAGVDG